MIRQRVSVSTICLSRGNTEGMATISTTYGYGIHKSKPKDADKELVSIVHDIQKYLKRTETKRFYLSITLKYHKRCCKSWARVGLQLQKFLNDPKSHYSLLMSTLEKEIEKFPKKSFYGERLLILHQLIEQGPEFTKKPKFYL